MISFLGDIRVVFTGVRAKSKDDRKMSFKHRLTSLKSRGVFRSVLKGQGESSKAVDDIML